MNTIQNNYEIYQCCWCKRKGDITKFGMMKKDRRYKVCARCRKDKGESILATIHEFCATRQLECISTEYKNNSAKMDWKCLRCSNEFSASYTSVKSSIYCGKCKKKKEYSIEYIYELCKGTYIQCLSIEYKNVNTLMEWYCLKCGYFWKEYMKNMKNLKCEKCDKMKKMDIQTVKDKVREIGFQLVDGEYFGSLYKHKWECMYCRVVCNTSYNNLMRKTGCGKCIYNRENYTLERVREIAEIREIECLESEYKNCNSPMKWRCKKCNKEWVTTWRGLKQNLGCKCVFKEKVALDMEYINIEFLETEYII